MDRKDRDAMVERLRAYFAAHHDHVVCAWLFGSVARNEARDDSDVDVAVLLDRPPPPSLPESGIALAGDIESSTGLPVDVVIMNSAPPDLVHRVLRDGIIVFERRRGERVAFEVKARNEYFDLKPYLDEYRRVAEAGRGRS
ncbi:MAG TPA: nucleotidyltransferase domain-containing protein [Zeimonas sp.]